MNNLRNWVAAAAMTLTFGLLTGCDTFSRPDIKNEPWDKPAASDNHPTTVPTATDNSTKP